MMLINNNWEQIDDLENGLRIIREYYNSDLAKRLEKLLPVHSDEEYYNLECELEDAEGTISALEEEVATLENRVGSLEDQIANLLAK